MDNPNVCSGKPGEAEFVIESFLKNNQDSLVNETVLRYLNGLPANEALNFKDQVNACNAARVKANHNLPEFHLY